MNLIDQQQEHDYTPFILFLIFSKPLFQAGKLLPKPPEFPPVHPQITPKTAKAAQ
jgi:hypothetical protein